MGTRHRVNLGQVPVLATIHVDLAQVLTHAFTHGHGHVFVLVIERTFGLLWVFR